MNSFTGIKATKKLLELLLQKLNMVELRMNELSREELLEIMAGTELDLSWIASQESVDEVKAEVAELRKIIHTLDNKTDDVYNIINRMGRDTYGLVSTAVYSSALYEGYSLDAATKAVEFSQISSSIVSTQGGNVIIYDFYPDSSGNKYLAKYTGGKKLWGGGSSNTGASFKTITFGDYIDFSLMASMDNIFSGMSSLTKINFGKGFDTSNVTRMMYLFENCSALKSLDLSRFDTSNVKFMNSMFAGCSSLTKLDLTSFDARKVTSMPSMFEGCTNLTEILVSRDKWPTLEGFSINNMFKNCGVDHVTYVD